jgi:hypothetical protein
MIIGKMLWGGEIFKRLSRVIQRGEVEPFNEILESVGEEQELRIASKRYKGGARFVGNIKEGLGLEDL